MTTRKNKDHDESDADALNEETFGDSDVANLISEPSLPSSGRPVDWDSSSKALAAQAKEHEKWRLQHGLRKPSADPRDRRETKELEEKNIDSYNDETFGTDGDDAFGPQNFGDDDYSHHGGDEDGDYKDDEAGDQEGEHEEGDYDGDTLSSVLKALEDDDEDDYGPIVGPTQMLDVPSSAHMTWPADELGREQRSESEGGGFVSSFLSYSPTYNGPISPRQHSDSLSSHNNTRPHSVSEPVPLQQQPPLSPTHSKASSVRSSVTTISSSTSTSSSLVSSPSSLSSKSTSGSSVQSLDEQRQASLSYPLPHPQLTQVNQAMSSYFPSSQAPDIPGVLSLAQLEAQLKSRSRAGAVTKPGDGPSSRDSPVPFRSYTPPPESTGLTPQTSPSIKPSTSPIPPVSPSQLRHVHPQQQYHLQQQQYQQMQASQEKALSPPRRGHHHRSVALHSLPLAQMQAQQHMRVSFSDNRDRRSSSNSSTHSYPDTFRQTHSLSQPGPLPQQHHRSSSPPIPEMPLHHRISAPVGPASAPTSPRHSLRQVPSAPSLSSLVNNPSSPRSSSPTSPPLIRSASPASMLAAGHPPPPLHIPSGGPNIRTGNLASQMRAPFGPNPPPTNNPPSAPTSTSPSNSNSSPRVPAGRPNWYVPLPRSRFERMTKQDMAYVIRMQLAQLQHTVTDPLADDFYHHVFSQRKIKGLSGMGTFPFVSRIDINNSGAHRNPDGSPKLPEGTLGRMAASSLKKPKKLSNLTGTGGEPVDEDEKTEEIKTNRSSSNSSSSTSSSTSSLSSSLSSSSSSASSSASSSSPSESEQGTGIETETEEKEESYLSITPKEFMFGKRSLVYLIEEGIRYLMNIEDGDSHLSYLGPQKRFEDPLRTYERAGLVEQRRQQMLRLAESLDLTPNNLSGSADHVIMKFIPIPKGRLLLFRSLLLMTPPLSFQLVSILLWDMKYLTYVERRCPTDDKLPQAISGLLYSMPFDWLNRCFHSCLIHRNLTNIIDVVRTKLGCMVLQVIMKRGHNATMEITRGGQGAPPVIPQHIVYWRQRFDELVNLLKGKLMALFDGLPRVEDLKKDEDLEKREEKDDMVCGGLLKEETELEGIKAKEEEEKQKAKAALEVLAYEHSMWELMAAICSHGRKDQRDMLAEELRERLATEINLFHQAQSQARDRMYSATKSYVSPRGSTSMNSLIPPISPSSSSRAPSPNPSPHHQTSPPHHIVRSPSNSSSGLYQSPPSSGGIPGSGGSGARSPSGSQSYPPLPTPLGPRPSSGSTPNNTPSSVSSPSGSRSPSSSLTGGLPPTIRSSSGSLGSISSGPRSPSGSFTNNNNTPVRSPSGSLTGSLTSSGGPRSPSGSLTGGGGGITPGTRSPSGSMGSISGSGNGNNTRPTSLSGSMGISIPNIHRDSSSGSNSSNNNLPTPTYPRPSRGSSQSSVMDNSNTTFQLPPPLRYLSSIAFTNSSSSTTNSPAMHSSSNSEQQQRSPTQHFTPLPPSSTAGTSTPLSTSAPVFYPPSSPTHRQYATR